MLQIKTSRKILIISTLLIVTILVIVNIAFYLIENETDYSVFNDVNKLPKKKVCLLLGTSKILPNNRENLYYKHRIKAVYELFKAGKIEYIVISGDNSKNDYNEPKDMKEDLIKLGIPEEIIYLDYAGFRTYDSVVRINKIFGQTEFIVVSQEFHNRRAVYIANKLGFKAIGYNAKDVSAYVGFKTNVRERFARANVFWDLLINKEPKYLGKKILIK